MSAGVFSRVESRVARRYQNFELHGADDIVRLLIAAADDAQMLSDARRRIQFDVDRRVGPISRPTARQVFDWTFVEQSSRATPSTTR